jgi:hypothetical protein
MSDARKRRPPAYQVYAADDLASSSYFPLSVSERGLLDSMQRACWVDDAVPCDPQLLARVLRLPEGDVRPHLTPKVLAHFVVDEDDRERLRSLELTRQMTNLLEIRGKQSVGGQKGAAIANAARSRGETKPRINRLQNNSGRLSGRPSGQPSGAELRRMESNGEELSQKQSIDKADGSSDAEHAEWVRDYDGAEEPSSTPKRAGHA